MAKQTSKVFAVEVYEIMLKGDEWKRVTRRGRGLLDFEGFLTKKVEDNVPFYGTARAAKAVILSEFGKKKDPRFIAAEPVVVAFIRE